MLLEELKYAFYVMFHPFDGFWDLKHEKRGSVRAATIILLLSVIVTVVEKVYVGFSYHYTRPQNIDFFRIVFGFLFPFVLWVVGSWCVTAIIDGEGSFKDIYLYSCYAFTPFIIITAIIVPLSNVLSTGEMGILTLLSSCAMIWTGGLLFFGTLVTQNFSLIKSIGTILLIILAIMIMLLVILLFVSLLQQIVTFFNVIYSEIFIRQ